MAGKVLFALLFGVTTIEFVDASAGLCLFLLSGIERMALGANVNLDYVAFFGRTGNESCSASANGSDFMIIGMYIFLHNLHSPEINLPIYYIRFNTLCQVFKPNFYQIVAFKCSNIVFYTLCSPYIRDNCVKSAILSTKKQSFSFHSFYRYVRLGKQFKRKFVGISLFVHDT